MELPTYTSIWKIEKRLYKLYDFRLPMPVPVGQVAAFLAIAAPYMLVLTLVGMPFSHTWVWLYVLPPGALAWLVTRPVLEGKRLPELVLSQVRYLAEPRTWCRLAPLAEKNQVIVMARVWRSPGGPATLGSINGGGPAAPETLSAPVGTVRPAWPDRPAVRAGVKARAGTVPGQLPAAAAALPTASAAAGVPLPARIDARLSAEPADLALVEAASVAADAPPRKVAADRADDVGAGEPGWLSARSPAARTDDGSLAGTDQATARISAAAAAGVRQDAATRTDFAGAVGSDAATSGAAAAVSASATPGAAGADDAGSAATGSDAATSGAAGADDAGSAATGSDAATSGAAGADDAGSAAVGCDGAASEAAATPAAQTSDARDSAPAAADARTAAARSKQTIRPVLTVRGDGAPGGPLRTVERALRTSQGSWNDHVVAVPGGHRPGKPDRAQRDQARARLPLAGPARIVVLGTTAGAGQTVTTLLTGQLLATLRGDAVAVLDLDSQPGSLTELARQLPRLLPSRLAAGRQAAGQARPGRDRGLQVVTASHNGTGPRDADRLIDTVVARYPITLADPAAADVPRAVQVADQLVLVAPAGAHSASSLAMTLEWLEAHGRARLAQAAITVLNGVSSRTMRHAERAAAVAAGRCRAIVRVPYDSQLAAGGALDPASVHAYTALAGVLISALADSVPAELSAAGRGPAGSSSR